MISPYKNTSVMETAKGIAVVLVIMGGVVDMPDGLRNYVNSFNIPLLFLLAGCSLNRELRFRELVSRGLRTLLLPYVVFAALSNVMFRLIGGLGGFASDMSWQEAAAGTLIGIRESSSTMYLGPLWILLALFAAELIFYILLKLSFGSNILLYVLVILMMSYGYYYADHNGDPLPWSMDIVMLLLPLVTLGYRIMTAKRDMFSYAKSIFVWLILLTASIYSGQADLKVNIYEGDYGQLPFSYIAAISGSLLVLSAAYLLRRHQGLRFFGQRAVLLLAVSPWAAGLSFIVLQSSGRRSNLGETLMMTLTLLTISIFIIKAIQSLLSLIRGIRSKGRAPAEGAAV